MAWSRLALLQASGEDQAVLGKMAEWFGYEKLPDKQSDQISYGILDIQMPPLQGITDDALPKRPPARFPCVNKIVHLETDRDDTQKPAYLSDPSMRLRPEDMPPGTYSFAAPRLLMPIARLLPLLFNSLGQPRVGNGLDHRCLVRRLARGQALHHLPKRHRQHWPQRLQIIVDTSTRLEPYWADFGFIVRQLQKLLGQEAVEAIRFDDDTLGSGQSYCLPWPTGDSDRWRLWQTPPAGVSILLLSDLGLDDSRAAVRWQRQLKVLQNHPGPILTLSPARRSPDDAPLYRKLKPNPLNDSFHLPCHPNRNGFALVEAGRKSLDEILAWLSPLPLIDAGLLRRLRDELQWGDSALESVIWKHSDIRRTGLGIRLHEHVAEAYRQKYRESYAGSVEAQSFWGIVAEHHAAAYQGLRQLETLNRCVLENQDDAEMRDYFQRLCATALQSDSNPTQQRALQQQCRTILASRPQAIWDSEFSDLAYSIYAAANSDRIRAGQWPEELEPGFNPERLAWMVGSEVMDSSPVAWNFLQIGSRGELQCFQASSADAAPHYIFQVVTSKAFPPRLIRGELPTAGQQLLFDGARFSIPEGSQIAIEAGNYRFELDAITKPSWASQISLSNATSRAARLSVSIHWAGKEFDNIGWFVNEQHKGGWALPADQYGLYADLTVNGVVQRFRWIEPGTFLMGSPEHEPEMLESEWVESTRQSELPHQVTLTQGFWLADTSVTQEFWLAVMGGVNPSHFRDHPKNPVEQVNWYDAQGFIERLNQLVLGLNAKLPSEAQWEYACRAGTTTRFAFGKDITAEQVNYNGMHPLSRYAPDLDRAKTVPVKSLPANAWGLFEMHGNVQEWCADAWRENLGSESVVDPFTPGKSGAQRAVRGGSWLDMRSAVRSASRYSYAPGHHNYLSGFRLALGYAERKPVE